MKLFFYKQCAIAWEVMMSEKINAYFIIEDELKKLPDLPGVYLMHGEVDEVIYVGKAISLKRRVKQYFQSSRNHSSKIRKMVSHITRFSFIVTDSEMEALVLESNLIKEYLPRYNTMLKDDKGYPYIRITYEEDFPRVVLARTMKKDKSKYFGPFTDVKGAKDILDLIHKLYQIRTCNRKLVAGQKHKERACLNYHMGQCQAPCQCCISKEAYLESIKMAQDFLNGNHQDILKTLKHKMATASENLEFEEAMLYRDLIASIKNIAEKQKISDYDFMDRDVIALATSGVDGIAQVFFMREGKMIGREHFHLQIAIGDSNEQVLGDFVKQYYAGTPYLPKEILLSHTIEEQDIIEEWLSSRRKKKVKILVPQIGTREKLLDLATRNAQIVLQQDKDKIISEKKKTIGAIRELGELLGLENIERLEAYDISNISGFESVGSMVVYENGKPKRSDYRKFKIKWVVGANDYASLKEVLTRRFLRSKEKSVGFEKQPNLILMDGGKGQVNIAKQVLEELRIDIPICGMVKDDHHQTRGLYYQNKEIEIHSHSEAFRLITRIQDEAHRFAIEYHRSLRQKSQTHSLLDDIKMIGPKRRVELMRAFDNLEKLQEASVEQLEKVEGMNKASAMAVYEFFHKE